MAARIHIPTSGMSAATAIRRSISPRVFQLQCRRQQSDGTSRTNRPDLEPMQRNEPKAPSPPPQDPNLLLMQIQAAQRAAQRRKFETPTHAGKLKSGEDDKSFHPALAGFLAGLMVAFGTSYLIYHFSGSYYVQKASQKINQDLNKEQKRIAIEANNSEVDESSLTAEEITGWLRRASRYYSTFHPNSEQFVDAREREIQKGLAQGADKVKEVQNIATDCAVELEKEVGPRNLAQNALSGLVTGRTGWYIIMKHLGRIEEAVEGKEFVEKRRQRAAKGIVDE